MSNYQCRCRALTIVELLIVMSIVGAVLALAMPALHGAREHSRRTVCSNNLAQLSLAMQQFASVKKRAPLVVPPGEIGGWSVELLPYLDLFDAYQTLVVHDPADPLKLQKYHLPKVMRCPSRPNQRFVFNSHYAMNGVDDSRFSDVPVSVERPWVSGLILASSMMANGEGPHSGGYLISGRDRAIQFVVDGRWTEQQ